MLRTLPLRVVVLSANSELQSLLNKCNSKGYKQSKPRDSNKC